MSLLIGLADASQFRATVNELTIDLADEDLNLPNWMNHLIAKNRASHGVLEADSMPDICDSR